MKLKSINGQVEFLMRTGNDFVKSIMPKETAERIIKDGKSEASATANGYTLSVDDKFFFAVEDENTEPLSIAPTKKKKAADKE